VDNFGDMLFRHGMTRPSSIPIPSPTVSGPPRGAADSDASVVPMATLAAVQAVAHPTIRGVAR